MTNISTWLDPVRALLVVVPFQPSFDTIRRPYQSVPHRYELDHPSVGDNCGLIFISTHF